MTILVVGGLGFIGSNLCSDLIRGGKQIRILDNFTSSAVEQVDGAELVIGSCTNREYVRASVRDASAVYFLAAVPGVETCARYPVESLEVNVEGLRIALEESARAGVRKFIFASSVGAVLGEQAQPAREDQIPHPQTIYGWSKLEGERLCQMYLKRLKIKILRFTNVYGENSWRKSSIIAKLMRLTDDTAITVNGDGQQTRDLVYVGDVCQGLINALRGEPGIYHIGSGVGVPLLKIIRVVEYVTQRQIQVRHGPAREGDVRDNWTSLDRAKEGLRYSPAYDLVEGTRQTWQNYFVHFKGSDKSTPVLRF